MNPLCGSATTLWSLQDSLWLPPAVAVVLATILASWLVALEPMPEWMPALFTFGGGPDSARAGSTFTVIGLVVSLTVVAQQMSSSQFTPRVLRSFSRTAACRSCSAASSPPACSTFRFCASFVPRTKVSRLFPDSP